MNVSLVKKLIPFAAAFDVSVCVAVFGHYVDPTLHVVGIVACAVSVVGALVAAYRD